jgi:two-component system sensor histidine kinase KdpD
MIAAMSDHKTPLILGFVTFYSNEINILKSIVRFARQQKAQWKLIYLNTPDLDLNPVQTEMKINSLTQLCATMGGTFSSINDIQVMDMMKMQVFELDVAGYCVQQILIDHHVQQLDAKYAVFSSLDSQIIKTSDDEGERSGIQMHNIDAEIECPGTLRRLGKKIHSFFSASLVDIAIGFLFGFFAILIALSVHFVLGQYLSQVPDTYVYLILIIFANVCALQAGIWGGIICTLLTTLGANYFFMNPVYEFQIHEVSSAVNWIAFIVTSALTSVISALMVMQYRKSEIKEKNLSVLLDINSSPLKHKDMRAILADLKEKLCHHLATDVVFFVPALINENTLEPAFEEDIDALGIDMDYIGTLWTNLRNGQVHAYKDDPQAHWVYLPLSTMNSDVGVLVIKRSNLLRALDQDLDYRTLSEMIATILEYIKSDQQSYAHDIMKEKDKLRMHILSSVSHDLKTPLASIIGSLGLYISSHSKLKEQQIKALVDNAYSEANRLDGFITNILVMTRLEAGLIKFRMEKIKPSQLVNAVVDKIRWRILDNHERVVVEHTDFADLIVVDVAAAELAMLNVVSNALRYSAADGMVRVSFERTAQNGFNIVVHNKGDAISENEMKQIFDKYHRLHKEDSQQAATGLGLALSHGLMRGQHGDITIENRDAGVAFILSWPAGSAV